MSEHFGIDGVITSRMPLVFLTRRSALPPDEPGADRSMSADRTRRSA
ncbi:hypothetical protein ACIBI4_27655 [Streptomyces sp. NPDC050418]